MTPSKGRQRRREATYRRGYEDGKRSAMSADPVKAALSLDCETCNGTGKEARHQICRDCDETAPSVAVTALELDGVPDALAYGKGIWRTCTGCHESNEGYPTGPYSDTLKCHLGGGCFECGGIGAIWDVTDYEDMGNFLALSTQAHNATGWRLAPEDATEEMISAALKVDWSNEDELGAAHNIWHAMLAAPPKKQEVGRDGS